MSFHAPTRTNSSVRIPRGRHGRDWLRRRGSEGAKKRSGSARRKRRPYLSQDDQDETKWWVQWGKNAWLDGVTQIAVPGDGDCFFSSVALLLKASPADVQATVRRNVEVYIEQKFGDHTMSPARAAATHAWTARHLRRMVALSILDGSAEALSALTQWYELARSKETRPLVPHMNQSVMAHAWQSSEFMRAVHDVMLDKNTYWADEYAIGALEHILGVKFLIIEIVGSHPWDRRARMRYGRDHGPDWTPVVYLLLYQSQEHYEPLMHHKVPAFRFESIPPMIRAMATHDNGNSVRQYINLRTESG